MIQPQNLSWASFRRLFGGLVMFAIEAVIVAGLALVAFLISTVILAIL
ncbi:MAG TPA: hypothetical protein VF148_08905 [Acidimicrobiia bacterium]